MASAEQVDLGHPARRPEVPVERLDAVLPDADVDGLGLGGHVGPQLRAAALGEELDPQRRAGRHRRDDRPHDDRDVGPAVGQGRGQARGRRTGFAPGPPRGPSRTPRPAPCPAIGASGFPTCEAEPRGQPADVVDGLTRFVEPGAPVSSWVA